MIEEIGVQLVLAGGDSERELDLRINESSATVADLCIALGTSPAQGLLVGDHVAGPALGLGEAGLYEGAEVRAAAGPAFATTADAGLAVELRVIGGLDAGRVVQLHQGEVTVGRDPTCDVVIGVPTVSRHHCRLRVGPGDATSVSDAGSRAGSWVEGARIEGDVPVAAGAVLEIGTVQLAIGTRTVQDRPAAVDPLRYATTAGTIPFNRPPRSTEPRVETPLALPKAPSEGSKPIFSVAALVSPLVLGLVMMVALQNVLFALFTLLTPVMVVGNWYESRFRNKRSLRKGMRDFQAALAALREQLAEKRRTEIERRRAASPDLAEMLRRATAPSVRLWERRPGHPDFLELSAGLADLSWTPPVVDDRTTPAPEVSATLAEFSTLTAVPAPVVLAKGGVVGITGDRDAALALARGLLCQVATLHGPADVRVAVLTAAEQTAVWDWTKWLPHTRDRAGAGGARLLAAGPDECDALLRTLLGGGAKKPGPVTLALIDDDNLTAGRHAPARALLRGDGGPAAGIVIASSADRLPALCTTVVEATGADGLATLTRPAEGQRVDRLVIGGLAEPTARRCARALSRFEDPEVHDAGGALPDLTSLLALLDLTEPTPAALLERWRRPLDGPTLAAPVGVSEEGTFVVDLVRDGPHALIGGTTGSGKSELLRSMVASMATVADPDHLTFVLIDYKGGSSFDECSRLPHCVGVVTDLDEQLGERALRCLEAELRHRERVLRDAGATDLPDYLRRQQRGEVAQRPLPRLVVVIDEFATMVKEIPDFIDSLVGVAQRGRSLGVHLILATQKPSGAVNDNIRTNTRLRICLRVEDRQDSTDVIDVADAADIVRLGRGCVRLRPGEVVLIQTALVTGSSAGGTQAPIDVAPFLFGRSARAATSARTARDGASDLSRLVDAVDAAFRHAGMALPRRPWPDALPDELDLDAVCPVPASPHPSATTPAGTTASFLLADDPDAQAQYPQGWNPARGNLLVVGNVGSGTTTTLASLALAQARTRGPDDLHLYVLDMGAGDLEPLAGLPHTGAYVGPRERERQMRLIRQLRAELDRRKGRGLAGAGGDPMIVLLIDNYSGFTAEYQDIATVNVVDELVRIFSDGPEVGILTVLGGDRAGAIPPALASLTQQKLLLRLSDSQDYSAFGITRRQVPRFTPGRALITETAQVVQVARPSPSLAAAVGATAAAAPVATRPIPGVGVLPDQVPVIAVAPAARLGAPPWFIPLGVGERDLGPAGLSLFEGDHALVAGPARSGKSSVLCTIAEVVTRSRSGIVCVGIAPRRSPLRDSPDLDRLATEPAEVGALLTAVAGDGRPHLVLIDDADALDDGDGSISTLLRRGRPDVHLVVAGRADALRPLYGHWTQTVRGSKLGVLLRPNPDLDGELLGTPLPRRVPVAMRDGRGYLIDSSGLDILQAALPSPGRVLSGGPAPPATRSPAWDAAPAGEAPGTTAGGDVDGTG
ncbi:MAG: segregation ATPase FtsK/SpoIIIE, family [Chloroflexota bacterium]|nr:segregation ATPase FtsK/SpoIIIE, family [Chloroflexota bacterium]